MNNDYETIQRKNCTIYIHKDFRSRPFEEALLAGEKELHNRYAPAPVPSSESARVYKFKADFQGVKRNIFFKEHISPSFWNLMKNLVRASRARRAFKATLMLTEHGFEVPALIAIGEEHFGPFPTRNFIATLEVENTKPIYEMVPDKHTPLTIEQLQSNRRLMRALGQSIGKMHAKGIFHGDLRAGNILAQRQNNDWRFIFLDNERTRKFKRLPEKLRLKNLVQVNFSFSNALSNTDRTRFLKAYLIENKIAENGRQKRDLINKIVKKTNRRLRLNKRVKAQLRKCLKTNERYLRLKNRNYIAVFNRILCRDANPIDFIAQIDALMDNGQILKTGDTCDLSRLTWNGKDVVVKRYNHQGFIHSLRHTIKRPRAHRCWLHAHRLIILNIPTPRPLAFIEYRKGPLVWKSYLITEYAEGQRFDDFLGDNKVNKQKQIEMFGRIKELSNVMAKHRISHGDLKHTNILINESGPVLTDLDGLKLHICSFGSSYRHARDIKRLTRHKDKTGR